MRNNLLIVLCMLSLSVFGQDFPYQSVNNPYYWKNRKPFDGYWQQDVNYRISAELNDSADIVSGKEVLTYTNNSPDTMYFLYFHLYQNAFIKGGYLEQLNLANGFKQKFGNYESAGKGTEILMVKVGGEAMLVNIDFSIMKVYLKSPILPHSAEEITIDFRTYFDAGGNQRRRMKMFKDNAGNKQYDVVHWYPRICVYDRKFGWETDQHLGKEFYGDFGEFHVSLTLPNQYIMDGTGELQNESEVLPSALREKLDIKNFAKKPWEEKASIIIEPNGSTKTWNYYAVNTHDFAWTCDPTYRFGEVQLLMPGNPRGKVRCIALVQEPHASGWQDAAFFCSKIIETYSRDFGVYAYPKMICADARDGMEYPMLTLDGGRSPGYYGLFAHEVGHNWFFGMVGNNETYRASLDEGFTQFLTHWSMSRLTREVKKANSRSAWLNRFYRPMPSMDQTVMMGYIRDAINKNDMPLNTHSDDFNGALNHGGGYGHVYYKTATMLYNLQYVLGDDLFLAAMQHYFNQWKMAHPYMEDFRNSIIQFTHVDLNWFFDQWLESTKTIDYGIRKVKHRKNGMLEIVLERKGEMQMPVDLLISSRDSVQTKITVPNTYFCKTDFGQPSGVWHGWGTLNPTYSLTIPFDKKCKNVQIDPSHRLADINELNNSWKCPVWFTFDHQINNPVDRKHYILKARPDLWYNHYDGLKMGFHMNGNYMNQKHVFKFTAWYNSGLFTKRDAAMYAQSSAIYPVHYNLSYRHRFTKFTDVFLQSSMLDGLFQHKLGIEKTQEQNTYRLFFKSMRRVQLYYLPGFQFADLQYGSFVPTLSSYDVWNNTLNLEMDRNYKALGGTGKLTLGIKGSAPFSDFGYAALTIQAIQTHQLARLELKTRLYATYISGSSIAPESQVYVAGANPEEMAENKYTRSAGMFPAEWFQYGQNINHFQAAGGLNLRAYTGYLLPINSGTNQYFLYRGNQGASVNMELDFDSYIPLRFGKLSRYFHIDSYLFGDAGFIGGNPASNPDRTAISGLKNIQSSILADAGLGFAFTIKRWGILDEIKPLTLRADFPLFINTLPFTESDYLNFRWVIGVSRAF